MISPELLPWLAALFFIIGIVAMVLELFLAGFGVAGVTGLIFIGWGILLLSGDIITTFQSLVIALVITIILFAAGVKLVTKAQLWRRVTLSTRLDKSQGYVAPREEWAKYQGMVGVAMTPLRPAGTIDIDGERLDAVTEGGYIPPRTKVQVVEVTGGRIVVRMVD